MKENVNNFWKLWAVLFVLALLVVVPGATAGLSGHHLGGGKFTPVQTEVFTGVGDDDDDTYGPIVEYHIDPVPAQYIDFVTLDEPEPEDQLPDNPGGRSSVLVIRGLYRLGWDLRLHLYQYNIIEWTFFNGYPHESDTAGYIEVWLDDAEQTYETGEFWLHSEWSGGPALMAIGNGFEVVMDEEEPWLWIHVYAERNVDSFPTEVHDIWIYKHLLFR